MFQIQEFLFLHVIQKIDSVFKGSSIHILLIKIKTQTYRE